MFLLKKILQNIWFWLFTIITISIILNNTYETIFYRPCSVHMWRQTDCASYALNYFQNKNSFFQPQVMCRNPDSGFTVSEFPAIYFFAGKLYEWFGFYDYYIRLINIFLFITGLIYLVLISSLYLKNKVLQLVPAVFALSSPYLFYYGANFLPDVPAMCLAFAGLYHFLVFIKSESRIQLIISVLFFTLAALLKISAGILWVASITSFFIHHFSKFSIERKLNLKNIILPFFLFVFSWIIILSWIDFAKSYNASHNYFGNLLGFYGIWDADIIEIKNVFSRFFKSWIWDIFSVSTLFFFISAFIYFFLKKKFLPKELYSISFFSFIGVHIYALGWFRAFYHHDYYMINIFFFPILFVLCFCVLVEKLHFVNLKQKFVLLTLIIVSLAWGVKHSARIQNFRYTDSQFKYMPDAVYEIGTYLRSIGIKKQEFVISATDPSPNMSLYLMNCIGRTEGYYNGETIDDFKKLGAKYFIAHDTANIIVPVLKDYCRKEIPIANYKGVLIYKLK